MKVLAAIGTRPEAIKMAPVVLALRRRERCETLLCASGQHREMLDIVLADFGLKPDIYLESPPPAPDLGTLTACLLQNMSTLLDSAAPDWVLAQGDTTTVMVTAMAAFYHKVRVGHVEAGLRSHDMGSPFPEEANRRLTAVLADLHFAPTAAARQNLLREGVDPARIHVTGNTVVDALNMMRERIATRADLLPEPVQAALRGGQRLVLVTCHRRENFGRPMRDICAAIARLAGENPGYSFVWPVHRNPRVASTVSEALPALPNIIRIDPLSYESLLAVLMRSTLALSDSGGIQEEAPSFGVPVLVLRDKTERPEGVAAGLATLVGADCGRIHAAASPILKGAGVSIPHVPNPYGDGLAGERIAQLLVG